MGVVRLYTNRTVLEAARDRMRFIYNEFEHVYVSFSGGKDSTVVLNLALECAEQMGRLPVPVVFIDQEGEWQHTIDYVREVMHDPRVDARWLQVPIRMNNAASIDEPWMWCWNPEQEEKWLRPKEPDSFHDNIYGTDIFKELFGAYVAYHHPRKPVAQLTGMRCEESPGRTLGLTSADVYKGITWAARQSKSGRKHFHFSPIYDWTYKDVWKAIHEFGWKYCGLYDKMYQYGLPIMQMRVSNVTHEMATRSLFFLQEIEPDTWAKLTQRVGGINSVGQLKESFYAPRKLPFMFKDWYEYRDYLLEHLTDDVGREFFGKVFPKFDEMYAEADEATKKELVWEQISAILRNDWEENTGLETFRMNFPDPKTKKRRDEARAKRMAIAKDGQQKLVISQEQAKGPARGTNSGAEL